MTTAAPLKVGVIGLGFGHKVHIPAFQSDPRFKIFGVCSERAEKAQAVAEELQLSFHTSRWQELVSHPEIDVIALAVPPLLQPTILKTAIQNKKHIFAEKPIGGDPTTAQELAQAAKKSGIAHIVDFEFEALKTWVKAFEMIKKNEIGRIQHAQVTWHLQTYAHQHGLVDSWKRLPHQGGGTLNSFVSHCFYYTEKFIGPITELSARFCDENGNREGLDDIVQIQAVCQGKIPLTINVSACSPSGNGHRFEIYGEKATLTLNNPARDYMNGFALYSRSQFGTSDLLLQREHAPGAEPTDGRSGVVSQMVKKLGDWIENKKPQTPSLHEGARVEHLIAQSRLSHQKQAWVKC